jgi:hypothetical protein
MKRFWLILLSLGLVMTFSASAFAVDVKFSGEFYVAGLYLNKISLDDNYSWKIGNTTYTGNPSTAFFYQRLRAETDFIVSPSLKLVTRFDALERIWGGARSVPWTGGKDANGNINDYFPSAGSRAENENIAFDWAYIDYQSPIGIFKVGYMEYGATGTVFGNSTYPAGRIRYYSYPIQGSININADISRIKDFSDSAVYSTTATDADDTVYGLEGVYSWKDGKAGMKAYYYNYADNRPASNYRKDYFLFTPYTIAKIGPVALQAEFSYATGKYKDFDNSTLGSEVRMEQYSGFIDATATFAPIYIGGTIAYVSGDDPNTKDVMEGGTLNGGTDWNPCLIMFNYYDLTNWVGLIGGYDTSLVQKTLPNYGNGYISGPMYNAWFGQGRIGVKPIPELDTMLSVSYAQADKKPAGFTGGNYGTEVDLTGTYKITNNLSYMLGFGYLFTGDYFKGKNGNNKVDDDYILMNKLTLTF